MYTLQIKNWFGRIHLPQMPALHEFTARVNQLLHDKFFWAMVGVAALIALFVGMFVWAIVHPELNRGVYEYPPYMMY